MSGRDADRAARLVAAADAVLAEGAVRGAEERVRAPASAPQLALWGLARPLPPTALRLDRAVGRVASSSFPAWRACTPDDLQGGGRATSSPVVDALAMHPNGRVRAAAVEAMSVNPTDHLAALNVRGVDPAPVVRGRAVGLALPAIATTRLHTVVSLAPILLGERMSRVSPAVFEAMERRLRSDPEATMDALGPHSHRVAEVLAEEPTVRAIYLLLMLPDDRFLTALLGDQTGAEAHRDFVVAALRAWDRQRRRTFGGPERPEADWLADLRRRYGGDAEVAGLLDHRPRPPP